MTEEGKDIQKTITKELKRGCGTAINNLFKLKENRNAGKSK